MLVKSIRRGLAATVAVCAAAAFLGLSGSAKADPNGPWMSPVLSASDRAHMLVGAMTLDQKIHMVGGNGSSVGKGAGSIGAIPELCVPALGLADGAGGLGNGNTGITAFPAPIGQAAAFDPGMQRKFGVALGQEFIAKGENVWLAPNVNMARYPLNGRNFEAYGEDP